MTLGRVATAVADAAATLAGMPPTPVPLERTDHAPWVWGSAQAWRSRVDPHLLADALRGHPAAASVTARPDGWLELTLAPEWVADTLAQLAAGAGMPPAHLPASPAGDPVARFEAARTAGGAAAVPPAVLTRRTLDNPAIVVLLARSRALRVAAQAAGPPPGSGGVDPAALSALDDPADLALLTEILDAPRRLAASGDTRPSETAAALLAVATAYLAWEQRCPAIPTRPGEVTTAVHQARQVISAAGLGVLERGMALLGISAPGRM